MNIELNNENIHKVKQILERYEQEGKTKYLKNYDEIKQTVDNFNADSTAMEEMNHLIQRFNITQDIKLLDNIIDIAEENNFKQPLAEAEEIKSNMTEVINFNDELRYDLSNL